MKLLAAAAAAAEALLEEIGTLLKEDGLAAVMRERIALLLLRRGIQRVVAVVETGTLLCVSGQHEACSSARARAPGFDSTS